MASTCKFRVIISTLTAVLLSFASAGFSPSSRTNLAVYWGMEDHTPYSLLFCQLTPMTDLAHSCQVKTPMDRAALSRGFQPTAPVSILVIPHPFPIILTDAIVDTEIDVSRPSHIGAHTSMPYTYAAGRLSLLAS